jgi:hypothetical protein
LEKIKALGVPEMEEAINAYNRITVSPEFRERERARIYARHNEASALGHARREGREEGRNEIIELLKSGKTLEDIINGLS